MAQIRLKDIEYDTLNVVQEVEIITLFGVPSAIVACVPVLCDGEG